MSGPARLALMALLFGLALPGCKDDGKKSPDSAAESGSAVNPLYAGYRFGGPGAVDIGTQPLTLPEGSVAELLGRDATLEARLKAKGSTLQLFPFYKGKDINHFLSGGDLEGGIFADMPAITAAALGDVVVVAMLKQGFASIISGKPMLVRDLKGKRVATGIGSAAHYTLLSALESEGLTEKDIKLVSMEVSDMPRALAVGRIDAFSAWEPTPMIAFATYPEFYLVHKGLSYGFLCLRRDFLTAHPAEAEEVAAAVVRACRWMRRSGNLEQVAAWTAASAERMQGMPYPLTPAQMGVITSNDLLKIPASPCLPDALLKEQGLLYRKFAFLKKAGKIPESTPWARVRDSFDIALLRQVMADPDRFALEGFNYRSSTKSDGAK